jgi:hypothetical protein
VALGQVLVVFRVVFRAGACNQRDILAVLAVLVEVVEVVEVVFRACNN